MGNRKIRKKEAKSMATQLAATPVIKGQMAKAILSEIKNTPSPKASIGAKKIIALFENKK